LPSCPLTSPFLSNLPHRNDTSMAMDAEGEHEVEMCTENSSSSWFGGESAKRERQEGEGMQAGGSRRSAAAESPGVCSAMVDDR